MTPRLYYDDPYLCEFEADVVATADNGRRVFLDRTAFYPDSGGQPCDHGEIGGVKLTAVEEEESSGRIAHILESPLAPGRVKCRIDWVRRFDHMQQHSGQHVLSAALMELFHLETVSFHLGQEVSTIDLQTAELSAGQVRQAERRANQIVFENRPVRILYADSGSGNLGLRKASGRGGELRIVEVEGFDRSACGGTHVRATGEIGPILIRKLDKIRGNVRLEFLCGFRAVARARADFEALSRIARALCSPLDDAPALVESHLERLTASEKTVKKLASELAVWQGRQLYETTEPEAGGFRLVWRREPQGPLGDEIRVLAQSFAAGGKAVFLAYCDQPPSLMLCVSADSGFHAGQILKAAVTAAGGRGGGNAQIAQGSVPAPDRLPAALDAIRAALKL
jgi:alanyl-tRNA synthetase